MISVGGGIGLLCMAVVGLIMSERRWVRILSGLYLMLYGVGIVVEVVSGRWNPVYLIFTVTLVLLGLYVYRVEHMFDGDIEPKSK